MSGQNILPNKFGLYNPDFEHESCGVGFVANVKGEKLTKLLQAELKFLKN